MVRAMRRLPTEASLLALLALTLSTAAAALAACVAWGEPAAAPATHATLPLVVSFSTCKHVYSSALTRLTIRVGGLELSLNLGGGSAYDLATLKIVGRYDELTHKFVSFTASEVVRKRDYVSPTDVWVVSVVRDRVTSENLTYTPAGLYVTYAAQIWFKVTHASLLPPGVSVTYDRYNLTCTAFIPADALAANLTQARAAPG